MVARIAAIATYIGSHKNSSGAAIESHLDEVGMGVLVAKKALEKITENHSPISMIIFASAGIRQIFPSAAAAIAESLGLNCPSFDIIAGCAGMGQAIEIASRMKGLILVISADVLSRTIDHAEPSHFALKRFADGAAAVLVSHDDLPGHRILAAHGETQAFCHHYYGARSGKVERALPSELKPMLSDAYLNAWTSITRHLCAHNSCEYYPWLYCNQGDQKLFEPLVQSLDVSELQIIRTGHGHAGGADPWIGLVNSPPPLGRNAILLSSGIGFHFHGVLLEIGQCKV